MLNILHTRDYDDMSRKAANLISAQILLKSDSVLGLATGSTPLGIYRILIERYRNGDLDFSRVRSVNLDEYQGLSRDHDQSYYYFMNENLFRHININRAETYLPDGTNMDAESECRRYHEILTRMGGIDLQLLGIGNNGHIGFNEPADVFSDHTNCVRLAESTIQANSRFFASPDDVPRYAYTMGIGEIMSAKRIVIVASGKAKAPILKEMLEGPVTPRVPASILRFHPDVTVVADEDALPF